VPRFIDISMPLSSQAVTWPGSPGIRIERATSLESGGESNVSTLDCDVHVGTHLENSLHFLRDGRPVDEIPLDLLVGPALVIHVADAASVGRAELEAARIPAGVTRLLMRTRNSDRSIYRDASFHDDYVGLTRDGATYLVERGVRLVGNDYLSIATFAEIVDTHHVLMTNDVAILEGLDLSNVAPGQYDLICLPLSLPGAEAAPARAILRVV
jgi:arylformamidase